MEDMNYFKEDENCYEEVKKLPFINEVLNPLLNQTCLKKLIVLVLVGEHLVFNPFEAQIDTGI
jgi:hypothetical protein